MLVTSLIRRFLVLMAIASGMLLLPLAQAQNNQGFYTLENVQPSEAAGKIEVLEFFAYTCPHCKTMEPMVQKWSSTLLGDVNFQRVPVAFNANMTDLQKLYYTLENLDRLDLHPKVFKAIHDEGKRIFSEKEIVKWVADQGIDAQHFSDVFNSFGIQSRVARANELIDNYQIEGTPSVAVGGRFVTSPALANGYQATLTQADQLIEKARELGQP